jgi:transitional endoplasmic reticulum ATPase
MSLPPYIYVDRQLESEEVTRDALESRQMTPFEDDERLERLHRILYPAFRATLHHETSKGQLIGTEEKEETIFLDGLWADNHADVAEYADEADSLLNVPTSDYDLGHRRVSGGRSCSSSRCRTTRRRRSYRTASRTTRR